MLNPLSSIFVLCYSKRPKRIEDRTRIVEQLYVVQSGPGGTFYLIVTRVNKTNRSCFECFFFLTGYHLYKLMCSSTTTSRSCWWTAASSHKGVLKLVLLPTSMLCTVTLHVSPRTSFTLQGDSFNCTSSHPPHFIWDLIRRLWQLVWMIVPSYYSPFSTF